MTTSQDVTPQDSVQTVLDTIRGTRDALSVGRVFGDPQDVGGATVIAVARVTGGAGGGGGEGHGKEDEEGSGYGSGFGLRSYPVGLYEIRDGEVSWKPSLDVTRLARGGQVLAGIFMVCLTMVLLRRSR